MESLCISGALQQKLDVCGQVVGPWSRWPSCYLWVDLILLYLVQMWLCMLLIWAPLKIAMMNMYGLAAPHAQPVLIVIPWVRTNCHRCHLNSFIASSKIRGPRIIPDRTSRSYIWLIVRRYLRQLLVVYRQVNPAVFYQSSSCSFICSSVSLCW